VGAIGPETGSTEGNDFNGTSWELGGPLKSLTEGVGRGGMNSCSGEASETRWYDV